MNADDLDYRARTLTGCIPPYFVLRLIELGYADEVEIQAGRGEWFCAREQAQQLASQQRPDEALAVLAPYVATGWWTASETTAALLESQGRIEEAITLTRPYADDGDRLAVDFFARLLARHGHADEALALLRPRIRDWFLAKALVAIAVNAGLDEDAAEMLTAHIEAQQRRPDEVEPFNAVGLLADVREGQGRIDEAIALLHSRGVTSVNNRDQLADLLARHGRIEELRTYAAAEQHGHAAQRLAQLLEERGDLDGAIAVYRQSPNRRDGAVHLAELLTRYDRNDEATEVLRFLADFNGPEDWVVDMLCQHHAAQGRPAEALAYLDTVKEHHGQEDWEFFRIRLPLLAACGLRDEAIEQARAHPESETWYAAESIAELLADAGRTEEAIALLEQRGGTNSTRAWHLINLGRIKDAIALLQQHQTRPVKQPETGTSSDQPPF